MWCSERQEKQENSHTLVRKPGIRHQASGLSFALIINMQCSHRKKERDKVKDKKEENNTIKNKKHVPFFTFFRYPLSSAERRYNARPVKRSTRLSLGSLSRSLTHWQFHFSAELLLTHSITRLLDSLNSPTLDS